MLDDLNAIIVVRLIRVCVCLFVYLTSNYTRHERLCGNKISMTILIYFSFIQNFFFKNKQKWWQTFVFGRLESATLLLYYKLSDRQRDLVFYREVVCSTTG